MPTPFLSSEEYDERAHQLYNDGQYEQALDVLREGLTLYPNAVELHVGVGYAQLAREEYAWARRSFEESLVLEPEHEDGLAGLGETLLKLGQDDAALRCLHRTLELGYADDVDLMLQIGRSLFREGSLRDRADLFDTSKDFFTVAVEQAPESVEARSCLGYALHRLGDDDAAVAALRRALQLDGEYAEARIYLANILYDRQDYEAALYHFERTGPDDHWDELGIWRLIELKRQLHKVDEHDPELKPWDERLSELASEIDAIDELLLELQPMPESPEAEVARGQLELFGSLLNSLADQRHDGPHQIVSLEGVEYTGSWEEIVERMRDDRGDTEHSIEEFMRRVARRTFRETGIHLPTHDAEAFLRGGADAGLLRIVQ